MAMVDQEIQTRLFFRHLTGKHLSAFVQGGRIGSGGGKEYNFDIIRDVFFDRLLDYLLDWLSKLGSDLEI